MGYSDIKSGKYDSTSTLAFDALPVGIPIRYDSAPKLIPLLETGSSAPYSFYLDSGVGFPPMGVTLDINGVLKGTPTGTGTSRFRVCVKDVGGRSACKMFSMTIVPKTTASKPTLNTNPTGGGQNTNVVQGTTRTEKWVGTYTSHNVDYIGGEMVCTRDTSAPISLCLTWKGQNFEGPIDAPEGSFNDTMSASNGNICAPLPSPRCFENEDGSLASCGDIYGYIDPSGNLKIDALNMEVSVSYDPKYPNPVTSAVMVGNSMTVEYEQANRLGQNFISSNKGSITATKVSNSCK